jgi:hypothetical protein
MPEINFDIAAARKAGATDNDIANYFKDNYKIDFDIVGARKAGANDNDILSYLNQQYGDLSQKKNEISSSPSLGTQSQLPLQKPKSLVPSVEPFLGNTLQESVAKNKEPKSELDNITASFKKGQLQGKIANALPIGRVPNADELSKVAEYEKELQSIPASENEQAFATEGFKIFKDPLKGAKFLTETITSSLSSLFESGKRTVPAAVGIGAVAGAPFAGIGAAVGAGTGLTAGLTTAGINLSTSGKILELLQSEGVDVSDKDSLVKAFSDENKMSVLRSKALKYGLPIALFDVVSGSIGGKLIAGAAGKSIAKKSLASLGEAAIQSSLGSGGELAGQIASGQKVDWNEVALEGVSSLATDLPDVAVGAMIERKKASSNNKTIAKQVGVLGKEVGTEDALHNLNRDLANKVITPQEYEEGVSFVEKAVKIDDTIPETIKGDNRATSIELIDERQKLEEEIIAREEQKKTIDVAFHKPLDEANKELSKRIDEINEELGEISKKRELPTEVPVEETQVPIVDSLKDVESAAKALEEGNKIQWNVFGNEESGEWTVIGTTKTRGGKDAVILSKVYVESSIDGKSYTKEYADANGIKYDNERIVEHIVPLEDLKSESLIKPTEPTKQPTVSETIPELKDVESTTKALDKIESTENNNVYYHATDNDDIISPDEIGYKKREGENVVQQGIYFGKDKEHLTDRYGNNIIKTILNIKNPLRIDNAYVDIDGRLIDYRSLSKDDINFLKNKGYDSIIFEMPDKNYSKWNETVVFDKNQITIINNKTSEAYHKAKADDSNPELVSSVEGLLSKEQAPALSDVESTAKALEEFQEYQQNELYNLTPSIYFGKDGKYGLESVAEAYHADKATGKETELTKAVEELLGKPKEEVKPTETEPIKLTEEQKQKAKETVDEIKKINLTHVEGTGMGSEQADGMYISTEKGGNRYATKDRPAKQVEVEIENPKVTTYEENKSLQKETTSELIEKEALGLEDVETQYWDGIKKHSGKGLSDITPKDVTNWFNSIKDKFKKETYEEYLKESGKLKVAKSITEKLKSEGYDALYIPESKNIEGELIVFDRSKVKEKGKEPSKVEPVKKSVIGIKPPKVEGDKITTISGKTEQERLDSIEKRKKETTVTEKVKAENDLWQDAQSLFSKNKNYLKSSEGLQELNRLRNKARALGFEVDLSRSAIVKKGKNGRLVKLKYNNKADSGAAVNENGIVILDRPKEVQDTFNEFNELGVFLDAKRPDGVRLTPEQIEGAIQDIIDGIPSNRANDYLDLLEKAIDENAYPIYDKGIGEANVRIEELRDALVGKENIGSPMDEESLISFLNEEANLTPEQEEQLLDNIDNLLTEYETEPATELPAETRPETEVSAVESKTEEGVSTKAEPITETTKREPTEIEMAYEKAKADRGIRNANMKQFVTENKDSIIAQLKLENKIKQECK